MNFDKIYNLSNIYFKLCNATIRSEMAKRIMHSILPGLASAEEVQGTKGVVDYKSLAAAVEGRKDVIEYGAIAIAKELEHYYNESWDEKRNKQFLDKLKELLDKKDYNLISKLGIELFSDKDCWASNYGGDPWKRISESVYMLSNLDKELIKLRNNKKDPDFVDKEIDVMKDIVIQLNIFDGLSHNTSSIMKNLIDVENKFLNKKEDYDRFNDEFSKIQRMMDAKELSNPIDVYREVEETLKESGDINRYKDWVTKIKGHPDYRNYDYKSRDENLYRIRIRKCSLKNRNLIKEGLKLLFNNYEKFKEIKNDIALYNKLFNESKNIVKGIIYNFLDIEYCVMDNRGENDQLYNNIISNLDSYKTNMRKLEEDLEYSVGRSAEYVQELIGKLCDIINDAYMYVESI